MRKAAVLLLLAGSMLALAACGNGAVSPDPIDPGSNGPFGYDAETDLDPVEDRLRTTPLARATEVEYTTYDGERVPAAFTVPRSDRPYRCVIFQGGLGSTREDQVFIAGQLVARDYGVFTIDPRFTGERATREVDPAIAAEDPKLFARMIRQTVIDLRRAIDYLEGRPECDEEGVGYIGTSLGAILGAALAGTDERVRAAALLVGGGDWRELILGTDDFLSGLERHPAQFAAALERLAPFDPVRWVKRISPRPVLIVNGRKDGAIARRSALALQRAAREPKEIFWFPGGHNPFVRSSAPIVIPRVLSFLDRNT